MSHVVEIVIILLVVAIAIAFVARCANVPYPIALVIGGTLLGFVPGLPHLPIDPNLLLVLVLPPILYEASLLTDWRGFRRNLRSISLLAVGLVLATTVVVAVAFKWFVPEVPWAVAFALGAIVSPPDAVAATAILGRMNMPRQAITVLEGESLVNDASGLVIYKFAVAAALTGVFSLYAAAGQFVLVSIGGIAVGYAIGCISIPVNKLLDDTMMDSLISIAVAYSAYVLADRLELSGVLAVVTVGLMRGQRAAEAFRAQSRILMQSLWRVLVFLLNALIFIIIGLQLPDIVARLGSYSNSQLLRISGTVTVVAMAVRMLWMFPGAYLPPLILRWFGRSEPMPSWRTVIVAGWSGMRGIVSLVAALALPLTLADGTPFPERDLLIFVAFVVIFLTLVIPGLTLAPLIRALRIGGDWGVFEERALARERIARAGMAEIERLLARREITEDVAAHLHRDFEIRLHASHPAQLMLSDADNQLKRARLAGVRAQRASLIALWREGRISDGVLHEIERELDFEELRLSHPR